MEDGQAATGGDEKNQALAEQATLDTSAETGHRELKVEAQAVEGTSAKTKEEEERARAKKRKAKGKEKVDPSYKGKNKSRDNATLNEDGKKKKKPKKKKKGFFVPPYWQNTTHRYPRSEPKRKLLGPNWPKWDSMVQVRFIVPHLIPNPNSSPRRSLTCFCFLRKFMRMTWMMGIGSRRASMMMTWREEEGEEDLEEGAEGGVEGEDLEAEGSPMMMPPQEEQRGRRVPGVRNCMVWSYSKKTSRMDPLSG